MDQRLKWLPDAGDTVWDTLGKLMCTGLPVPAGYIVYSTAPEDEIRTNYEELKIREKTHFVAVRGPSHAVLNVIQPDPLIHTLRRLWRESTDGAVLIQRMVSAVWCGKAHRHRKNLRIKANEGMMVLDPDTYLVNAVTGKCIRRVLEPKQRKMIRHVDGSAKVVEREGERTPMPAEQLDAIAQLATRAGADITWAIDDVERLWLLGLQMRIEK
jgi:hypothetical protein